MWYQSRACTLRFDEDPLVSSELPLKSTVKSWYSWLALMIDRSNIAELLAIVSTTSGSKTTLCLKYSQTPIKQKDLRKSSIKGIKPLKNVEKHEHPKQIRDETSPDYIVNMSWNYSILAMQTWKEVDWHRAQCRVSQSTAAAKIIKPSCHRSTANTGLLNQRGQANKARTLYASDKT